MNPLNPETLLLSLGLRPLTWGQVLLEVEEKLSAPDWETFRKLHRIFVGYGSEENLLRFYAFVYNKGLEGILNGFRFDRLQSILSELSPKMQPGLRILDVGAGSGFLATAILSQFAPKEYVTQDLCPEIRMHLLIKGLAVLPHPAPVEPPGGPFDVILCADSLGELNADEDEGIAEALKSGQSNIPDMLEERFGFAFKLETWKPYLSSQGRVFLWEPFSQREVWGALAELLRTHGWTTKMHKEDEANPFLELTFTATPPESHLPSPSSPH